MGRCSSERVTTAVRTCGPFQGKLTIFLYSIGNNTKSAGATEVGDRGCTRTTVHRYFRDERSIILLSLHVLKIYLEAFCGASTTYITRKRLVRPDVPDILLVVTSLPWVPFKCVTHAAFADSNSLQPGVQKRPTLSDCMEMQCPRKCRRTV